MVERIVARFAANAVSAEESVGSQWSAVSGQWSIVSGQWSVVDVTGS
jgi:hypothetical protein